MRGRSGESSWTLESGTRRVLNRKGAFRSSKCARRITRREGRKGQRMAVGAAGEGCASLHTRGLGR